MAPNREERDATVSWYESLFEEEQVNDDGNRRLPGKRRSRMRYTERGRVVEYRVYHSPIIWSLSRVHALRFLLDF